MAPTSMKDRIKEDMIAAMRAKDKETLGVIRMLQAAIKQKEIDNRITVDDPDVLNIIEKMIKQRRESAKLFEQGNRPELAAKEIQEISVLQEYMPKAIDEAELDALIQQTIKEVSASSMRDMGKVMNTLRPQIQGRADMGQVSAKIKALLS